MPSLILIAVAAVVWLFVALLIDRFLLSNLCLPCANAVTAELSFKIPGLNLPFPPVSLIVLLLLPIVFWSIVALPWRKPFTKSAWQEALTRWAQPWFWLLLALVIPIAGHFIYAVLSEYLPKGVTKLAEAVALQTKIEVTWPGYKPHTPFDLNASLAGFLGFAIGIYLFLKNVLQRVAK